MHTGVQKIFWLEWKITSQLPSFESINIYIFILPGNTEMTEPNHTEIVFLLDYKCSLFPEIYVHDRKHER